ncbi:MAG: hypothetical protein J6Q67_02685, partial [Clostridia bacterium]|nr:hypothetical protein [Clostridia bacterium]
EVKYDIPEKLVAPLNKGSVVGKVTYLSNNKTVFEGDIYVIENVEAMGLFTIYFKILRYILAG